MHGLETLGSVRELTRTERVKDGGMNIEHMTGG